MAGDVSIWFWFCHVAPAAAAYWIIPYGGFAKCEANRGGKAFTYSFLLLLLPLHSTKSQITARGEVKGNKVETESSVVPTDMFMEEEMFHSSTCSSWSHSQRASWRYLYQFTRLIIDLSVTVWWVPWLSYPVCPSDPQLAQMGRQGGRWGLAVRVRGGSSGLGSTQLGVCLSARHGSLHSHSKVQISTLKPVSK